MRYPLAAAAGALVIGAAVFAFTRGDGNGHVVEQGPQSRRVTHEGLSFEPPNGWRFDTLPDPRTGGRAGLVAKTGVTVTLLRGRKVATNGWQEIEVAGHKAYQVDRRAGERFIRQILIEDWGTVAFDTQAPTLQEYLPLFEQMVLTMRID